MSGRYIGKLLVSEIEELLKLANIDYNHVKLRTDKLQLLRDFMSDNDINDVYYNNIKQSLITKMEQRKELINQIELIKSKDDKTDLSKKTIKELTMKLEDIKKDINDTIAFYKTEYPSMNVDNIKTLKDIDEIDNYMDNSWAPYNKYYKFNRTDIEQTTSNYNKWKDRITERINKRFANKIINDDKTDNELNIFFDVDIQKDKDIELQ